MRPWILLVALSACSSLSDEDQIRLTTFKQNSKQFYDQEQFVRAEDQCRKGLLIEPEDLSLNQVLAYSLLRQRSIEKLHEAEQVFRACLELEEDDLRNQLGLAEVLYQLGVDYEDRVPILAADERYPPEDRLRKVTTAQQESKRCLTQAEEMLDSVLGSNRGRDNTWAHNLLSRLYAIEGRYEESSTVLTHLIGLLGNSIKLRRSQVDRSGLSEDNQRRFDAEIERLERQQNEALHLLANVSAKREAWESVVSAYSMLEASNALELPDYYNRAMAYDQIGAREDAIADLDAYKTKAASRGAAFSENVHRAMNRLAELRAGLPTRYEEARAR